MTRENLLGGNHFRPFMVLAALAVVGAVSLLMPVGSASAAAPDTMPPKVVGVSPASNTTDVPVSANVRVTFSEKMNPETLSGKTFKLFDKSGTRGIRVSTRIWCNRLCRTATLHPKSALKPATSYVAVIRGDDEGVKDLAGNALAKNKRWSFLTTSVATKDVTEPALDITTPAADATYALNQDVKADYSCHDEVDGSGLKSCEGTVADGSSIDTAVAGQKTFTVNATDNAGNTTSVSHTYTVSECTMLGTEGTDTLAGTVGDDVICGLAGNDTIRGLEGNDILRGGGDHDKLYGGEGNDTLDGGLGTDGVDFSGSPLGVVASLVTNTADGEGSDTLTSVESLLGSRYADRLTGSAKTNYLYGASGADTLLGLEGADTLSGAYGDDHLRGAAGNDKLKGGAGADDLLGEEDDDALNSQDGVSDNDLLDGGAGTDTMATDATEASIANIP